MRVGRINAALCAFTLTFVFFVFPQRLQADVGTVAAAISAPIAIHNLTQSADDLLGKARDAADLEMGLAALKAKQIIALLEATVEEQRAKTIGDLDKATQDTYGRISLLLSQAHDGLVDAQTLSSQLEGSILQISGLLDKNSERSYVLRYSPMVATPGSIEPLRILVSGVNLDETGATLDLNGQQMLPASITKGELVFELPRSQLPFADEQTILMSRSLHYQTVGRGWWNALWGRRLPAKRDLAFLLLPKHAATYSLVAKTTTRERVNDEVVTIQVGPIQHDRSDNKNLILPEKGWYVDVDSLKPIGPNGKPVALTQRAGNQGQCNGFDQSNWSPDGFTLLTHTGHINGNLGHLGGPGWVSCAITYRRYQLGDVSKQVTSEGNVAWGSDLPLELPPNTTSYILTVKAFDGTSQVFTGPDRGKYYEIQASEKSLIIRPKPPKGLAL